MIFYLILAGEKMFLLGFKDEKKSYKYNKLFQLHNIIWIVLLKDGRWTIKMEGMEGKSGWENSEKWPRQKIFNLFTRFKINK